MLKVNQINDKHIWEGFLLSDRIKNVSFFQSWNWGEVQKRLGNSISRFGFYKDNTLIGVCLSVEIKARRGHYLHLRHGPVLLHFLSDFSECLSQIIVYAKNKSCDFVRMSPLIEEESFELESLSGLGLRNAPIHNMDAENAWILDLSKTEEELLKGMRKSTRYLIKKGKGMPITIRVGNTKKDFNAFMKLYVQTSQRHSFVPHRGIQEEFDIFSVDNQIALYLAEYNNKIISGAMVLFYGKQAVYHHGSFDERFRDIPGAYLIQWQAIRDAKKRGLALYNFWGVVSEDKPNHPWKGLTLFKMGFGGNRVNYVHAQDFPLTPWYWKTYSIEFVTKLRKGY